MRTQWEASSLPPERGSHKNLTRLAPSSLPFSLHNCEKYLSVVYKLPILWYFVIANQMDQDIMLLLFTRPLFDVELLYKTFPFRSSSIRPVVRALLRAMAFHHYLKLSNSFFCLFVKFLFLVIFCPELFWFTLSQY